MKEIALLINNEGMLENVSEAVTQTGTSDIIELIMTHTYQESEEIAHKFIAKGGKMIIARGGHANWLRKSGISIPVIRIPFTGHNIASLLVNATNDWGEFAVIGNETMIQMTRELERPIGAKVHYYTVKEWSDFDAITAKIRHDGIMAVVGGYDAVAVARKNGLHDYCIKTSVFELITAINDAKQLNTEMNLEKQWSVLFEATLNTLGEGVMILGEEDEVRYANRMAKKLLGVGEITRIPIKEMNENVEKIRINPVPIYDELYEFNDYKFTASFLPVHTKELSIAIVMQEVQYVHKIERTIRQKLANKGLVAKNTFESICAESPELQKAVQTAKKYSVTNSSILIAGETGTGKELFAQSIHNYSLRNNEAFVAVNCASIPSNLLESELFGYADGAFTGAKRGGKVGLFELAHKGTIFLDEIGEISLDTQAHLLRVLEEHEIMRVGDDRVIPVDIRVIAASNRNLKKMVEEGTFRSDLYYRLDVLSIKLPSLRECKETIEKLVLQYTARFAEENRKQSIDYLPEALEVLKEYSWPGNVRELKNVVERIVVTNYGGTVSAEQVYNALQVTTHNQKGKIQIQSDSGTIGEAELELIKSTLEQCDGNKTLTAKKLGISRPTLHRRLKQMREDGNV